jgi:hypothetical protein
VADLTEREDLVLAHAQAIGIATRRLRAILGEGATETEALTMLTSIEESLASIQEVLAAPSEVTHAERNDEGGTS